MRLWRLDRIVSADLLDRGFQRSEEFNLSDYAAQSFGVFQEEPFDVVLRFTPEAADDAARALVPRRADRLVTPVTWASRAGFFRGIAYNSELFIPHCIGVMDHAMQVTAQMPNGR